MPAQDECLGWTHKFWEPCRQEVAQRHLHANKDDPILAHLETGRDGVTFCFAQDVRFHDEQMYQLRRIKTDERWTHELWECCRFEETAPWMRSTDKGKPILACIDVEGDITFHLRDKVRVQNKRIYQFLKLKPG